MAMKNTINIYEYDLSEICNELQKSALIIVPARPSCSQSFLFPSWNEGNIVLCRDRNDDPCSGIRSWGDQIPLL